MYSDVKMKIKDNSVEQRKHIQTKLGEIKKSV